VARIRWTDRGIVRQVAGYTWCRENGFVCDVKEPGLVPELLTVGGFELVAPDDLTQIEGIGDARAAELLLEMGIASFEDLAEADEEAVARACGVSVITAGGWVLAAAGWVAVEDAEIAAAMSRGCCG